MLCAHTLPKASGRRPCHHLDGWSTQPVSFVRISKKNQTKLTVNDSHVYSESNRITGPRARPNRDEEREEQDVKSEEAREARDSPKKDVDIDAAERKRLEWEYHVTPPLKSTDIIAWNADVCMRRAREAARIADNAVLEAWRRQREARDFAHQALVAEAAAFRALPLAPPKRPGGLFDYPLTPVQAARLKPRTPPGWELPVAPLVDLKGTNSVGVFDAWSKPEHQEVPGKATLPVRSSFLAVAGLPAHEMILFCSLLSSRKTTQVKSDAFRRHVSWAAEHCSAAGAFRFL